MATRFFGATVVLLVSFPLWVSGCGSSSTSGQSSRAASGVLVADNGGLIVAANVDGSGYRTLTQPPVGFVDSDPAPSPDGALIAFVRDSDSVPHAVVQVMRADGSGLRKVSEIRKPGPDWDYSPVWAPDGSLLAYQTDEGITVVRPDGGGERLIVAKGEPAIYGVSWSPDSRSLAYSGEAGVSIVDVSSGEQKRVIELPGNQWWAPSWSPNGSRLAVIDALQEGGDDVEDVVNRVVLMKSDGSDVHSVGPPVNSGYSDWPDSLSWSPDGSKLAFATDQGPGTVAVVDASSGRVTMRVKPLAGGMAAAPSWSPDGTDIAFLRSDTTNGPGINRDGDIWVARADGTGDVQVTRRFPLGGSSSVPRWLPGVRAVRPVAALRATKLHATNVRQLGTGYEIAAVDGNAAVVVSRWPTKGRTALGIWRVGKATAWIKTNAIWPQDVALSGPRVYWSYWYREGAGFWTARWPGGRAVRLPPTNDPYVRVAGDRSLVVYSLTDSLFRLQGTVARRIRREPGKDLFLALSVSAGRALLLRQPPKSLEVIDGSGRLLTTVAASADVQALADPIGEYRASLSGGRLIVVGEKRISVFRVRDGVLRSRWPVGPVGVADEVGIPYGSLVPYRSGEHWHLLDVDSGRDRILLINGLSPKSVAITNAGLFYTAMRPYAGNNGQIGLVPLNTLRNTIK